MSCGHQFIPGIFSCALFKSEPYVPVSIQIKGVCPLLSVFDMAASLAFYRDLLGFEIVQAAPPSAAADEFGWAWLRRGETEVMLNTQYDPDAVRPVERDAARVAAHEDTVLYFGCPDVDGAYNHFRDRGCNVAPPKVTYYGMTQLYVKDPDGYSLCFQWQAHAQ